MCIVNCRFSSCHWSGHENEIFEHLECKHKHFLREPKGNLYFDLTFEDLQREAFAFCSSKGLYWFRQDLRQLRSDGVEFGLFHIGGSEQVKYKLKLYLNPDGYCEYWGPFTSQQDQIQQFNKSEQYNFKFDFKYLEMLKEYAPPPRLHLYFGEYHYDENSRRPGPGVETVGEENDKLANRLCVERFTCPVCFNYIRRDARFCENKHFICLSCFDRIQKDKKLKCPVGRCDYLYDCMDANLERLLRMVNWTDISECEFDKEMLDYTFPVLKLSK